MEVGAWRGKRAAEAARADEADAANVRLMAELDAARLQLQVHMRFKYGVCVNEHSVLCRARLAAISHLLAAWCAFDSSSARKLCIHRMFMAAKLRPLAWLQLEPQWHPDLTARTAGLTAWPAMHISQNMVPRAEAREARNAADAREAVEAAQAAAAAALAAELEVVRRGRADAEAREAALQEEVHPRYGPSKSREPPLHALGACRASRWGESLLPGQSAAKQGAAGAAVQGPTPHTATAASAAAGLLLRL